MTMILLAYSIQNGSLSNDPKVQPFKTIFSELCTSTDGIILRGERIIMPASLQSRCIDLAHEGHLGVVKTK